MKISNRKLFFLPALILFIGLASIYQPRAQTLTTLHYFNGNTEGQWPDAGVALSGDTLYGTTPAGTTNNNGTVFKVNADGTGFAVLHVFSSDANGYDTNSDGAQPRLAPLAIFGSTLYGTTPVGGPNGIGTVFALNTDGTGFRTLHNFSSGAVNSSLLRLTNSDGANPYAGLLFSSNKLYGTTEYGGTNGMGTVFAMNVDGTGFTTLYTFSPITNFVTYQTNNDGANPTAGLVLSDNTLFGTTSSGGRYAQGTIFKLNTDGSGFLVLYNLRGSSFNLILSGDTLYGTTSIGGSNGNGTVFAVNTNGTSYSTLYSFGQLYYHSNGSSEADTNSDGADPRGGLTFGGGRLYGAAFEGGTGGEGTLFALNTDGTGFTTLHNFSQGNYPQNTDGYNPNGGLTLDGGTLYGTASLGGLITGTVFSLSLEQEYAPQLTIFFSKSNVILSWPTNAAGFTLKSTTNLSSATWSAVSPAPVIVNGQNTVTNPIAALQMFYRLSQ